MLILTLGLLGCLGAPVVLMVLVVAVLADRRQHQMPRSPPGRYTHRVWVGGHRTKRGWRKGHYKRR